MFGSCAPPLPATSCRSHCPPTTTGRASQCRGGGGAPAPMLLVRSAGGNRSTMSALNLARARATRRISIVALLALLPALGLAPARAADAWPARAIRWIVPYVPGGGTDITARLLAPKLSEGLGQQIVIDNRPGAGGNLGTELVANAPPDGYTILFATVANSINDSLYANLPFSIERDLAPVVMLTSLPN